MAQSQLSLLGRLTQEDQPVLGLSTALAVLQKGFVIVGNVPSKDGTAATVTPGSLLVIDNQGHLVSTISGPNIDGPWDMTIIDGGNQAIAFVSNVLAGTVVRLNLNVSATGVTVDEHDCDCIRI